MNDTELLSSGDVLKRIDGLDLTYATVHRWIRNGAITPTRPPAGTGSDTGWSHRDADALHAIAHVRHDLATLGLPCPWKLVAELWDQLDTTNIAGLHHGTVTITVHIGSGDE